MLKNCKLDNTFVTEAKKQISECSFLSVEQYLIRETQVVHFPNELKALLRKIPP